MPTSLPRGSGQRRHRQSRFWTQDDVHMLAIAALPAVVVCLALTLPPVLILPAIAVIAIGTGFALEGARLIRWGRKGAMHLREYAAGLVFAGLAATILADAEGAMLALSELAADGSTRTAKDN